MSSWHNTPTLYELTENFSTNLDAVSDINEDSSLLYPNPSQIDSSTSLVEDGLHTTPQRPLAKYSIIPNNLVLLRVSRPKRREVPVELLEAKIKRIV